MSSAIQSDKYSRMFLRGAVCELRGAPAAVGQRSFSLLAYTGAVVSRLIGRMVFELKGISFKPIIPILKNHSSEDICGQSTGVSLVSAGLRVEGVLSAVTRAGREIADLADEGFRWQASVGLEFTGSDMERLEDGETAVVNGQTLSGPLYIVRNSILRETSFVPVGADGDTLGEVLSLEGSAGGDVPPAAPDFIGLASDIATERGISLNAAMSALASEQPRLHADWLEHLADERRRAAEDTAANAIDFMALARERSSQRGISLGTAIQQLAAEKPDVHSAWVMSQRLNPRTHARPKSK